MLPHLPLYLRLACCLSVSSWFPLTSVSTPNNLLSGILLPFLFFFVSWISVIFYFTYALLSWIQYQRWKNVIDNVRLLIKYSRDSLWLSCERLFAVSTVFTTSRCASVCWSVGPMFSVRSGTTILSDSADRLLIGECNCGHTDISWCLHACAHSCDPDAAARDCRQIIAALSLGLDSFGVLNRLLIITLNVTMNDNGELVETVLLVNVHRSSSQFPKQHQQHSVMDAGTRLPPSSWFACLAVSRCRDWWRLVTTNAHVV